VEVIERDNDPMTMIRCSQLDTKPLGWLGILIVPLALLVTPPAWGADQPNAVAVDASFPGGNIVVESIRGDEVTLHQDLRDTEGDWFYWHFRVRHAAGRTITFTFTRPNVLGVRGPAASLDGGRTWTWLGTAAVHRNAFRYTFPASAGEVRFCVCIPYVASQLGEFLKRYENHPALKVESLCRSQKGRDVAMLRLGCLKGSPKYRVLLTARHHACESMANYVLEGIFETLLDAGADGAWLRDHVEFLAVPFMDTDGVEDGDQGKNRKPHDHNRDYLQKIYPSVKALTERVPAWSGGKLRVTLDVHCPWLRGGQNEWIYFVGGPDAENWKRVTRFAEILEAVQQGPLRYRVRDNLPFGKAWNQKLTDPSLKTCAGWAAELPGVRVATSLEVPFANALGGEVNAPAARALGHDLARTLRPYLETLP
jgi:hypothetical protein